MEENPQRIALFIDFENIALGVKETSTTTFDVNLVLDRMIEKGKIVAKRAYADWEQYAAYKRSFHEAAIEMIDIPRRAYTGKNSADIRLVVDALDMCYAKGDFISSFVICSGDSDFSPLVSKLRENGKTVIGLGVKKSTSKLLVNNCDEFVFYDDLMLSSQQAPSIKGLPKKKQEVFRLLIEAIKALWRENKEVLWGSMVKQTMQRKRPDFNEEYFGYSTFSQLLEDAEKHHIVRLHRDSKSGTYIILGFDTGK
jgi:uncharacterized protein (TIGR00288 family)